MEANRVVGDYFQALPPENPREAASVEDLRHSIMIAQALFGAGLIKDAARILRTGLAEALVIRLGAYAMAVELLTPLASAGDRLSRAYLATVRYLQGRYDEAIRLELNLLADFLADDDAAEVGTCLGRLSMVHLNAGQPLHASSLMDLRTDLLAATGGNPRRHAGLMLQRATLSLRSGDLKSARRLLSRAGRTRRHRPPGFDGDLELNRLEVDMHGSRRFRVARLDRLAERLTSTRHRLRIADIRVRMLLMNGEPGAALAAAEEQEHVARNAEVETAPAAIAYLLARTGRREEAESAVEECLVRIDRIHAADRPHHFLAEALAELDRHREAISHAEKAYRQAWCDGPPHHRHWELLAARDLLTRLGARSPDLAITDPATVDFPAARAVLTFIERQRTA